MFGRDENRTRPYRPDGSFSVNSPSSVTDFPRPESKFIFQKKKKNSHTQNTEIHTKRKSKAKKKKKKTNYKRFLILTPIGIEAERRRRCCSEKASQAT